MSSVPDAVQLPEELCEGIGEQYFESTYGDYTNRDYTDEDYSHQSDSGSISSPEWEPLEQDVDEGDNLVSFDVDTEMECIQAAGMYSAGVTLYVFISVTISPDSY